MVPPAAEGGERFQPPAALLKVVFKSATSGRMTLDAVAIGRPVRVAAVSGERSFRRRIQELGLVPGTVVELLRVAPLGDPLELRARGCLLSIRRAEAAAIAVEP